MNAERLLRRYIREVLGAADPWAAGKDLHGGNLYTSGYGGMPASIRGSNDNVLNDEDDEEQQRKQSTKQAACCLVLADDGKVLAVSRRDDPNAWGMPGGKVDPGEEPIEAAARELKEETGLDATRLHQVFVKQDAEGFVTYTFACEVEGQINTEESGVIRWVHPSVLTDPTMSPFTDYNVELFKQLGLPMK